MKRAFVASLIFVASFSAFAANGEPIIYAGGTVPILTQGAEGTLDTTQPDSLSFRSQTIQLTIPYQKMRKFEYEKQVAHHLGVLPLIAVSLVKMRQENHFVRITFLDEKNVAQIAIFELPKHVPETLLPVLQTRAPTACTPNPITRCKLPMR